MKTVRDIFREFLQGKGLRLTPQRELILNVFWKNESHMSSEELYDLVRRRNRAAGQATVYRTLKLLSESGIAREVDFGDGAIRFEHDYGHEHHDHLICTRCRKTVEVLDNRIEKMQENLAARHGFRLTGHRLDLFGVCTDCTQ